jgi:glycerophosphoryl diester phosphodiesterase
VQQRLPSLLERPIAFAHRGARAHAVENTIEAFRLALRLGATGLESDVWLTSDGVPVLDHDGMLRSGVRRRRPFASVPRAALPAHVPTLADLLDACGDSYHLSLDLKDPASGPRVIDIVRDVTPDLLPRLWLCHPDHASLVPIRELSDDVKLIDSTRHNRIKEGAERRAATLSSRGIDGINLHHSDWNGGLVALFHRFGLIAFGWDMQFEHILRPALRMGIDGVYSDHVDVMVDAYRAELGWP